MFVMLRTIPGSLSQ